MAEVKLANAIEPTVMNDYFLLPSADQTKFSLSGIVANAGADVFSKNRVITTPYWNDLISTGNDAENVTDSNATTIDNITSGTMDSVRLIKKKAWGANALVAALAGDDPMARIGSRVGNWWAREHQKFQVATLVGALGAAAATNVVNTTGVAFSLNSFLDSTNLMGEYVDTLTIVLMHPDVYNALKKANAITFVQQSVDVSFETYQGMRVVKSSDMPTGTTIVGGAVGDYLTLALAPGFLATVRNTSPSVIPVETFRNPAVGGGSDVLYTRQDWTIVPRGVSWTGGVFGAMPANGETPAIADLANAGNWNKVFDARQLQITGYVHTI